jgi:tyrosine decarboxylase/aspartate 1-decarboxylase
VNELPLEVGKSRGRLFQDLEAMLGKDLTYESGRILGSMCTKPHSFAARVYRKYIEKNLGDPGLFPATQKIERETIHMLGTLLGKPDVAGHIVTGGTEANILAIWAARNLQETKQGDFIVPASAHHSFDKAADLLGCKLVRVRLNHELQVDPAAVRKAIGPRTFAIVGVAGTTELGVVDPISDLAEIAEEHSLHLHVDAAFGGFVIPFLGSAIKEKMKFDFRLAGVSSITMDPHKMGMCPIPAGGIFFRNEEMASAISTNFTYLCGGETTHQTIVGTRSGAAALATWAMLKHLGHSGYQKMVKRCLKLTNQLVAGIQEIEGLEVVIPPTMNVVGIKSNVMDIEILAQQVRELSWAVALFPHHIRIVIMPHVKESHILKFLEDLRRIIEPFVR